MKPFPRRASKASNYYTLSYYPANKNYNGKFRKIKVTLTDRSYHLHYSPVFYAEDPDTPVKNANLYQNVGTAAMRRAAPQSRLRILFAAQVVPVGAKQKIDSAKTGKILLASTKKKLILPATDGEKSSITRLTMRWIALVCVFVPKEDDIRHCSLGFHDHLF